MADGWIAVTFLLESTSAETAEQAVRDHVNTSTELRADTDHNGDLEIRTADNRFRVQRDDTLDPRDQQTLMIPLRFDRLVRDVESAYLNDGTTVIEAVYEAVDPAYVCGMANSHMDLIGLDIEDPITESGLRSNRINKPTCLMLFPPEMVETYGSEWLLDLPVPYAEELDDGAILTLTMTDFGKFEYDVDMLEALWEARESLEELFEARHAEL